MPVANRGESGLQFATGAYGLTTFCGARADVKKLRSNKSPPVGLTVAVTTFEPSLYVKRYSPPGCFFGAPASKNLNKPQGPGYLSVEPVCEPPADGWYLLTEFVLLVGVTVEVDEFAELLAPVVEASVVEPAASTEPRLMITRDSPVLNGNFNVF